MEIDNFNKKELHENWPEEKKENGLSDLFDLLEKAPEKVWKELNNEMQKLHKSEEKERKEVIDKTKYALDKLKSEILSNQQKEKNIEWKHKRKKIIQDTLWKISKVFWKNKLSENTHKIEN